MHRVLTKFLPLLLEHQMPFRSVWGLLLWKIVCKTSQVELISSSFRIWSGYLKTTAGLQHFSDAFPLQPIAEQSRAAGSYLTLVSMSHTSLVLFFNQPPSSSSHPPSPQHHHHHHRPLSWCVWAPQRGGACSATDMYKLCVSVCVHVCVCVSVWARPVWAQPVRAALWMC